MFYNDTMSNIYKLHKYTLLLHKLHYYLYQLSYKIEEIKKITTNQRDNYVYFIGEILF